MAATLVRSSVNGGGYDEDVWGRTFVRFRDVTLDSSYPSGGYAIAPADLGLKLISGIQQLGGITAAAAAYHLAWDHDAKKLRVVARGPEVQAVAPGGGDIKGSANTDSVDTDEATAPTNADYIDTLHAVSGGAWTYTEDLEPDVPRNVVILLKADAGGDTVPATLSFLVTGTFRGVAQSETITFSFTDTSLAADQHRYKYGVKPFERITNVVPTGLTGTQNGLLIGVGLGSKLGTPAPFGVDGDVIKLTKNGADLATASIVSATNQTVNFGTLANGDDVAIQYLASGEATAGRDLSTLKYRVAFLGL